MANMRLRIGAGSALSVAAVDLGGTLGSYTLLTKLESGGMATVYVGSRQGVAGFERLLAIKCCHPHLRDDTEFVHMFLDEAKLAARIHHPNVVATLDVACADVLYLVMDYIEGGSLSSLLRRAARDRVSLPFEVTLRIVIDALTGLHAAHELRGSDGLALNLVHRDVSPQNILVGVDGVSRITDFGVAFAAARETMTRDGRIKGKFAYMAPEQVKNHEANRRMDVFAAGVVLWEALAGRTLFRRKDDIATINAVLALDVPPPSKLVPGLPSALDAIVLKALQFDPDERYATAAEFADALEQLPIECAPSRAVAAYVEAALGPELTERRSRIREASEQGQPALPVHSAVHKSVVGSIDDGRQPTDTELTAIVGRERVDALAEPPSTIPPPPEAAGAAIAPEVIEHRRIRGLIAAAMLLLVGSALGLLLARSSGESGSAPARPSAASPSATSSAGGGQASQTERVTGQPKATAPR